ncbi:transferase [Pseudodesulfovibrio tunisiensis]|uniref:transferase n=1 Tax=Pseudodesulfovibrio tunisiensis TaxID=463192 RepID=UPI001FB47852|nr:transferase [Pseudodesulfovibrio tunisiensis]
MKQLEALFDHITSRVNVNLKPMGVDVAPYLKNAVPRERHARYYAFYALTTDHPMHFRFRSSSLSGTYFLGKTFVDRSILYKSDLRGDELKAKGDEVEFEGGRTRLFQDESFLISNSFLNKTLVHNNSKNPQIPEYFRILNTVAMPWANIHGTTTEGVYLGPFSTVDLSVMHSCVVGDFAYVQAGDLSRETIEPGRVWIKYDGLFEFDYVYPAGVVEKYVSLDGNGRLSGEFSDYLDERKEDFVPIYSSVVPDAMENVPDDAFVSLYAVIKGDCAVGHNALVAQRAHIENSRLGDGANAQENCYILNSRYDGMDVTAHGGKVIHTHLGIKVFVGFNSFLRGSENAEITVGTNSIVMPHTIIDAEEPIHVPDNSLVWGYVTRQADLDTQCISLDEFAKAKVLSLGNMRFQGDGAAFVRAFKHRIDHILEENGAYYDGSEETKGHAQKTQKVSFNILQPFQSGDATGMYPTMTIGDNA